MPLAPNDTEEALRRGQVDVGTLGGVLQDHAVAAGGLRSLFNDYELFGTFAGGQIVLRNDFMESAKEKPGAGPAPAWLEVELRDENGKNRFGVGARIEVRAAGRKQIRPVCCGDSYLSQHPLAQHFGFGAFDGKVDVAVRWPGDPAGKEQVVKDVAPRQRLTIRRER